jgi:hypothetical protein
MGTPWIKSVRDTKQLTVFNGIGAGHWVKIFAVALEAFNIFAKSAGVRVAKASDEQQANVVMRLADGVAKYEYEGTEYTKAFSGTGLHGLTRVLTRDGVIEKAFVFLPLRPQVTVFDNRGNASDQMAGQDVMKVIAVHELIHACCLNDDNDHGGDGIFYYPLEHQNGKLYVPQKGKNQALMPPIRADHMITRKIKELW